MVVMRASGLGWCGTPPTRSTAPVSRSLQQPRGEAQTNAPPGPGSRSGARKDTCHDSITGALPVSPPPRFGDEDADAVVAHFLAVREIVSCECSGYFAVFTQSDRTENRVQREPQAAHARAQHRQGNVARS